MFHHFLWIIKLTIHQETILNFSGAEAVEKNSENMNLSLSLCHGNVGLGFILGKGRGRQIRCLLEQQCFNPGVTLGHYLWEPVEIYDQGELRRADSAWAGY